MLTHLQDPQINCMVFAVGFSFSLLKTIRLPSCSRC